MASQHKTVRAFRLTHGTFHHRDPDSGEQKIARKDDRVMFTQAQAKAYSDMIIPWRDNPVTSPIEEEFDSSEEEEEEEAEG